MRTNRNMAGGPRVLPPVPPLPGDALPQAGPTQLGREHEEAGATGNGLHGRRRPSGARLGEARTAAPWPRTRGIKGLWVPTSIFTPHRINPDPWAPPSPGHRKRRFPAAQHIHTHTYASSRKGRGRAEASCGPHLAVRGATFHSIPWLPAGSRGTLGQTLPPTPDAPGQARGTGKSQKSLGAKTQQRLGLPSGLRLCPRFLSVRPGQDGARHMDRGRKVNGE